ncbi:hypothetical protein J3L18_23440 [Mucilaginibacter gossypii]|uniref:hypothetical protein n=1 Tax=Mucilaginibacter gossypii TaxID=551996 RepID=UPI000DCD9440|nr:MULTISPECIES: hypothetical protein [Mucilaginibacter]QTE36065.1 hypothetical protein J3L18_23440 [Mucilaginibacter gossypii]RAV60021.1 hypothetical protein DIU36_03375 [Mucilaginibacter rubeus]
MLKYSRWLIVMAALLTTASCRKPGNATTAFYYWKTGFNLNQQQTALLKQTGNNAYIRFFDVSWNDREQRSYPNAIVQLNELPAGLNITPVIYITNKTFENTADTAVVSLAEHCNKLINELAAERKINYTKVQVDCDWSLSTRDKYFSFLKAFKKLNKKQLEATIRLHQVKFKDRTGVPPADRGVLMFYNMGKLNSDLQQPNSIYNSDDADKYIAYLGRYPLKLDIALPLFSWAIHIREGRVIQVYGKIGRRQLSDQAHFEPIEGQANYRAKTSFFLDGIYIKQNDIFKLEETDSNTLNAAAQQLTQHLPKQKHTTIIYYELANIDLSKFNQETLTQISARF